MSRANGDLWLDITDMWHWRGSFTGIQNVVDNFVQRFIATGTVKLFVFEPEHRSYRAVPVEEWQTRRRSILTTVLHTDSDGPQEARPLKAMVRHHAAVTLKRVTPVPIKRYARQRLNEYRAQKHGQVRKGKHPFHDGDTVLIIGGNWGDDYRGFAEGLVDIRKQHDIMLMHFVHDMIPALYPNYYNPGSTLSFTRYFGILAKAVDAYVVNSIATKQDLEQFLQAKRDTVPPIKVIRLGEDFPNVDRPRKPDLPIESEFILCVGTIESRKNQALLYYTVKLALQRGIKIPQLVIAGRKGWMAGDALHHLTADPDLKGKVLVSHTIDDAQKAWLFEHCQFSVYPSFCEGWGLPVVESLHNGKVSICANQSSLPEAGEDYAEYISPYDSAELLERIVFLSDPVNRREREAHIAQRPSFTWDDAFTIFNNTVDELIRGNKRG